MTVPTRRGFTLIEVLVVVVIIGILAAVAIPKFRASKDKAKLATVKTDLKNLRTAQEAYYGYKGRYTTALSATLFKLSTGNTASMTGGTLSFTGTVTNASISGTPKSCKVSVGVTATTEGKMICS
ncbi:MAG: prepilin-type N-terminal cleavage/methylation domain-containing protein [Gemmatimonadales bacterium]|nr:prepilin-type N-terminal cleavage/methylation domain-containing protein [Gemmatimonadales bacterium]